jgi:hypothetical protein
MKEMNVPFRTVVLCFYRLLSWVRNLGQNQETCCVARFEHFSFKLATAMSVLIAQKIFELRSLVSQFVVTQLSAWHPLSTL